MNDSKDTRAVLDKVFPNRNYTQFIGEGWHNKLFLIDDKYVIRLGKSIRCHTKTEMYVEIYSELKNEYVEIPKINFADKITDNDSFKYYSVYDYLRGTTQSKLYQYDNSTIEKLGNFLTHLHSIELSDFQTKEINNSRYENFLRELNRIRFELASSLKPTELKLITGLYRVFLDSGHWKSKLHLTHSDLTPNNILVFKNTISVIDWDGLSIEDQLHDFSTFPHDIALKLLQHYKCDIGPNWFERFRFQVIRRASLNLVYSLDSSDRKPEGYLKLLREKLNIYFPLG